MDPKGPQMQCLRGRRKADSKPSRPISAGKAEPKGGEKGAAGPKGQKSDFLGVGLGPDGPKSGHSGTPVSEAVCPCEWGGKKILSGGIRSYGLRRSSRPTEDLPVSKGRASMWANSNPDYEKLSPARLLELLFDK